MSDQTFFANVFNHFGLLGVWGLVSFEAFEFVASLPIGPFIVILGGLASHGSISVVALWFTVYTAVVTGDNLGFFVGRKFGRPILQRFGSRLIKQKNIDKAEGFFVRYGAIAVFFTRFIIATIAAPLNVIAGASDLPWRKFIIADLLGQAGWASMYVFLGYFLADDIERIVGIVQEAHVTLISLITLVVVVAVGLVYYRAIRKHVRMVKKYKQSPR